MLKTGIIRRIDDLGRVVLPKEIRNRLGISEGDPLEIFIDPENESVTLKRDTSEDTVSVHLRRLQQAAYELSNIPIEKRKILLGKIKELKEFSDSLSEEG